MNQYSKQDKKFLRQCASCRTIKNKSDLIRITKDVETQTVKINQTGEIQGRSVYICKNSECVEKALKKNRIDVLLKGKSPENIKDELYAVLKN